MLFAKFAPKLIRSQIIRDPHNTLVGGNLGINKTSQKIRERFHWYKMDEDIRIHIHNCLKCCATKQPTKKPKARRRKYLVGYPSGNIGIYIMGPPNRKHVHFSNSWLFHKIHWSLMHSQPTGRYNSAEAGNGIHLLKKEEIWKWTVQRNPKVIRKPKIEQLLTDHAQTDLLNVQMVL